MGFGLGGFATTGAGLAAGKKEKVLEMVRAPGALQGLVRPGSHLLGGVYPLDFVADSLVDLFCNSWPGLRSSWHG